jgi:hypothetical protein
MRTRLGAAVFAFVLIAAACGASQATPAPTATAPGQTAGPTSQPTTGEPSPTESTTLAPGQTAGPTTGPGPTSQPADKVPLQEPELESPEDIAQAMFNPDLAEQSVVSMLDELGIGIYQPDGTPIRAGTEASDADLYLYEPEVRGLIDMLNESDQFETWITFRDFHAALAGLGLQASAEELAAAYADAYGANPEAPMAQFVTATTYPDAESTMTRFSAWLLLLDGFVPPHASAGRAPIAAVGGFVAASPGPGGGSWGTASNNVVALPGLPLSADPLVIAHLMTVVAQTSVSVSASPGTVHEGHGGNGSPADVTATVRAAASVFVSPFSGQALIPINAGSASGIPVTWTTDAVANRHGSVDINQTAGATTDALGQAKLTYTPKKEDADGFGIEVTDVSLVQAVVSGQDLITRLYGRPDLGALVPGQVIGVGLLTIEWHDEAMEITLTNHYDVAIDVVIGDTHAVGDDSFSGTLAKQEDGTWRGTVSGTASGNQDSQAFGESCSSSWFATQQLEVIGEEGSNAFGGDFVFRFYPITDPVGSMGSGTCPPTRHKLNGVSYAPFNDFGISQPDAGGGIFVILPQKPGGVADYPVPALPPGSGITIKNTSWHVDIQFPVP